MEIYLNDRVAEVNILEFNGTYLKAEVDGKIYHLDHARVHEGRYSIINEGKVIELDVGKTAKPKTYEINTGCQIFKTEVVDAEAKYQRNRTSDELAGEDNTISSPMPGKIVSINCKEGEEVEAGQTLVIVSAMKMESEYKAGINGIVKKIHVKADDTVDGNQTLITLE